MAQQEIVLVTGGTGFVGMHIILQLLQQGYHVRTTVRSLNSKPKLIEALTSQGITNSDNLTFAEAELTEDANWTEAMKGCKYVMSVASPVFFHQPRNEEEAIRPALDGILRVLKFAKQAGVKRVVMTSNFGAVGFSHTDTSTITTEEDWTDTSLRGLSVYEKSKTLAERAAWDFIKQEGKGLEFAAINPVAILGPSLNGHVSGSFHIISNMFDGTIKAIPNIPLNIVDVRDVAELHIRAMVTPEANGQRFIATADGQIKGAISFFDGSATQVLHAGECCIVRKNSLVRFVVKDSTEGFEPVLFCFDEPFLRSFQSKYAPAIAAGNAEDDALIKVEGSGLLQNFMDSLKPYQTGIMQLEEAFEDVKYEELLIILLKTNPGISSVLFNFAPPEKINLEAFMNRHFNFNVSMSRFAFLTGRSLSAFKRDFEAIFGDSPGHWLVRKRLQEAHFLINADGKSPSEIYLQLGFESLSHFSVAFKKMFGHAPTAKQH